MQLGPSKQASPTPSADGCSLWDLNFEKNLKAFDIEKDVTKSPFSSGKLCIVAPSPFISVNRYTCLAF